MWKKPSFWLYLILALLLLLVGLLAAGPWLAIRGIERGLAERSPGQLSRHIDFPALRVSLKAQLSDHMVRSAGPTIQANPLGALALGTAGQLAGAGIDAVVTPAGVITLLHGQGAWRRATGQRQNADTYAAPAPPDPFDAIDWRYESPSRFTATRHDADGRQTRFIFVRQGLRWRLVDVRLEDPAALLHLLD